MKERLELSGGNMAQAIRCTLVNCSCESFTPAKLKRRVCESCRHGWVAHALSKMRLRPLPAVELVDSSGVLEVASLLLFGTSAIPVRMKILLDRLFSVLTHSEVNRILSALDWSLQDYIRGYTLQDISGKVLDRWAVMSFDEEVVALQQFLRFGETKSIVERMALQDQEDQGVLVPGAYSGSEIQSFLEKSSSRPTEEQDASGSNRRHHFETALHSGGVVLPLLTSPPVYSCPAPFLSSPSGSQKPLAGLECTEVPLDGAGAFTTATTRAELLQENNSPKLELEELSLSGPSTPSEHTHGSPEVRTRCIDKSGSLKKGRVFCSACEKTFYDKGTLKIHFNAVHLKIKHRCTVEGCNMVFSSLRSRNRHSANPNPRLHMPINRNSRDKDIRGILCPGQDPGLGEDRSPSGSESKTSTGFLTRSSEPKPPGPGQSSVLFPSLKTVQPVLPFYRSLVPPAELAHTPGALPSLPPISSSMPGTQIEPTPKKKPRKSSMPIKIEKEESDTESIAKEELGHDESLINKEAAEETMAEQQSPPVSPMADEERAGHWHHSFPLSPASLSKPNSEQEFWASEETPSSSRYTHFSDLCGSEPGIQSLDRREERDEHSNPCQICRKSFKNPYSVRMHYRNVHLRELHLCTVEGCNAAFPSRRSRDRHSANLNLHLRLLNTNGAVGAICIPKEIPNPQGQLNLQTSRVIPMSKSSGDAVEFGASERNVAEEFESDLGAVLDLSTRGSGRSSGDSGSEDGLPMEDGEESCDGLGENMRPHTHMVTPASIQCQLCGRAFSSRGSLRAHYRSVHLRLLLQCTIPGCTNKFSSARSRNRHSQNRNLHRNLSQE